MKNANSVLCKFFVLLLLIFFFVTHVYELSKDSLDLLRNSLIDKRIYLSSENYELFEPSYKSRY